jgi:hypothetical protein
LRWLLLELIVFGMRARMLGRRIRNRPNWWPESAGSAAAWLLATMDREYGPDFIACRKPSRRRQRRQAVVVDRIRISRR